MKKQQIKKTEETSFFIEKTYNDFMNIKGYIERLYANETTKGTNKEYNELCEKWITLNELEKDLRKLKEKYVFININ